MNKIFVIALVLLGLFLSSGVSAGSRERCAAVWADDHVMQEYCLERQLKGFRDVGAFLERHGISKTKKRQPWSRMFARCTSMWLDKYGPDWPMVAYCLVLQERPISPRKYR